MREGGPRSKFIFRRKLASEGRVGQRLKGRIEGKGEAFVQNEGGRRCVGGVLLLVQNVGRNKSA
jgi:hypothetical protein